MRAMYGSLLGLVISGTSGCLLFTDTINVPPTISISGPAEVRRGQGNNFMVSVANEGQGQTALEWRTGMDCPTTVDQAEKTGAVIGNLDTAVVKIGEGGPTACVWVVARDRRGARAFDAHQLAVSDPRLELKGPANLVSGQSAEFIASYPAEPELSARFYWATAPSCTAAREMVMKMKGLARQERRGADRFLLERIPRQAFCVAVLAEDEYDVDTVAEGAMGKPLNGDPFIRRVTPQSTATTVPPTVPGEPIPLFADVQLAAGEDNDFLPDEPVTFTWKITTPGGADLPVTSCPDVRPAGSRICFQPELAGIYKVELAILDAGTSRVAPPLELRVEDQAPCIKTTTPNFLNADRLVEFEQQQRNFTVLEVQDDGDPLPAPARPSERGFSWHVKQPGDTKFDWLLNERSPTFIIPPRRYQALQRVEVRLEYRDRVTLHNRQARSLAHCDPAAPRCEIRKDCYAWVTWTVDYQ